MTRKRPTKKLKKKKQIIVRSSSERKICDLQFSTNVTGTPGIASLISITNGTGVTERIGSRIFPKEYVVNVTLTASTTLIGSTVSSIRLIWFTDLQQIQGTAPTISDYFNPPSVTSQRNIYFMNRFKVYRDVVLKVDTYNPVINYRTKIALNSYIGFGSLLATDITKNGLYFIYISDNSINPPVMVYNGRLLFTDN